MKGWSRRFSICRVISESGSLLSKSRKYLMRSLPWRPPIRSSALSFISRFSPGMTRCLSAWDAGTHRTNTGSGSQQIKAAVPEAVALSADVIVGFAGEGEKHFQNTVKLLEDEGFSRVHAFRYSIRPGTSAELLKGTMSSPRLQERTDARPCGQVGQGFAPPLCREIYRKADPGPCGNWGERLLRPVCACPMEWGS